MEDGRIGGGDTGVVTALSSPTSVSSESCEEASFLGEASRTASGFPGL